MYFAAPEHAGRALPTPGRRPRGAGGAGLQRHGRRQRASDAGRRAQHPRRPVRRSRSSCPATPSRWRAATSRRSPSVLDGRDHRRSSTRLADARSAGRCGSRGRRTSAFGLPQRARRRLAPCTCTTSLRGSAQVFSDGHTRIDGLTRNGQPYIGEGQLVRVDARFCKVPGSIGTKIVARRIVAGRADRRAVDGRGHPRRRLARQAGRRVEGDRWAFAGGGHRDPGRRGGRRDDPDGSSPTLASAPYGVTSQGAADPGAARRRVPAGAPPAPRSAGRVPRWRDRSLDHPPGPQASGERHRRRHDHRRRRELGAAAPRLRHARAGRPAQLPGGARRGRVARRPALPASLHDRRARRPQLRQPVPGRA